MARRKVSATIDPDRLAAAREVAGFERSVSEVLDLALGSYVERVLEERWLAAHPEDAGDDDRDLPGEVPVDLSHLPWDDDER
jgi:hypothetical protein